MAKIENTVLPRPTINLCQQFNNHLTIPRFATRTSPVFRAAECLVGYAKYTLSYRDHEILVQFENRNLNIILFHQNLLRLFAQCSDLYNE
jgi:hypothetical protein